MRKLHQLYARVFGYFWLPCPLCSRMFGGHETGTTHIAYIHDNGVRVTKVTCKRHNDGRTHR